MIDNEIAQIRSKADMLRLIERTRDDLLAFVREHGSSMVTDAAGWTVKDHLTHLTAWERSMVYLLNGRPRHEGLGISDALYLAGDEDAMNAAIREVTRTQSLEDALAEFDSVHADLLAALDRLSEEKLSRTCSHFLPDEPGEEDGTPVFGYIIGNTCGHYPDHLGWMREIVAGGGSPDHG